MTFPDRTLGPHHLPKPKPVLLLIAVLGTAVAIGVIAAAQTPILVIGCILAVLLIFVTLAWPEALTLATLFILYTNAAVVAVQFHNVPFIVGAAVPLLLVIPLTNYRILRREKLIFHPILLLLVLFLMIQILGALRAVRLDVAMSNLITSVTEGLGLYFLITNVVRTPETLRRVIWVLLLAGALLGGLSFYQQVSQTYDDNYGGFAQMTNAAFGTGEETLMGEVEQPRLAGPIGSHNRYAQILLMLVPLGLFRFWGERSYWLRFLAAIATAFIALGVALTFSRGAAAGFVLMIIIVVFMGYIKPLQVVIIGLGLVLLLQAVPQYSMRLASLEALSGVVSSEGDASVTSADGSTKSRLTEMGAAALVFADHPVIGVGPGMFKYYYQDYANLIGLRVQKGARQAHSLFPGLAAENGSLGLICFMAILYITLRNLARTRKRWEQSRPELANMATGFLLAITGYITTGIFAHFGYIRFFWLMMALAAMASYVADVEVPKKKVQNP